MLLKLLFARVFIATWLIIPMKIKRIGKQHVLRWGIDWSISPPWNGVCKVNLCPQRACVGNLTPRQPWWEGISRRRLGPRTRSAPGTAATVFSGVGCRHRRGLGCGVLQPPLLFSPSPALCLPPGEDPTRSPAAEVGTMLSDLPTSRTKESLLVVSHPAVVLWRSPKMEWNGI